MFYLVEITKTNGQVAPAIYPCETEFEALKKFHQKMGGAMNNASFEDESLYILDDSRTRCIMSERMMARPVEESQFDIDQEEIDLT